MLHEQKIAQEAADQLAALAASDPQKFLAQFSQLAKSAAAIGGLTVGGGVTTAGAFGADIPTIETLGIPVVSGVEGGVKDLTQFLDDRALKALSDFSHVPFDQIPPQILDGATGVLAAIFTIVQARRVLLRRGVLIHAMQTIGVETTELRESE